MKTNRQKLILASTISISAVLVLAFFVNPHSAHAEKLYAVLDPATGGSTYNTIKSVWNQILALINYAMVGVLLFIAFTNILRIDVSRYGIKKFLPTMLLAVILANFSWTICRLMIDFANIVCDALIRGPGTGAGIDPGTNVLGIAGSFNKFKPEYESFINNTNGTFDWAQVFRLFILTAMEFVGAGVVLVLAFLFLLRNYVIYFVVSISPLAFMSMVLPQTKKFYDQWWQNFMKWTFMPIVSLFWLWVGAKWIAPLTSTYSPFLAVVFGIVTYYMAITSPFKMGGSLMSSYANWSKKAAGALGGDAAKGAVQRGAREWWAKQGESENKLNPFRNLARGAANYRENIKHQEARTANRDQNILASLDKNSLSGQRRLQEAATFGGERDKSRAAVMAAYQKTDKGKEWMQGRQKWLDEKENLEADEKRGFSKANSVFKDSATGQRLLQEQTRIAQDALMYEDTLKNTQQKNMIDFFKNNGAYNNADDKKLVKGYMAATTRNMVYEEGVKKSRQDLIDKVLEDQNHMENMKVEAEIANTKISDMRRLKRLSALIDGGRELDDNQSEQWGKLDKEYGSIENLDAEMSNLSDRKNEIVGEAKNFYDGLMNSGYKHVAHMFDTANNKINGFMGIAAEQDDLSGMDFTQGEHKITGDIGKLLMTRTGKLLTIEIKGDIEKRLDEATIEELAAEIDPNGGGRFSEASKNFSNGLRHKNKPSDNREVEARRLAIARVAKQNSNAEAPSAQRALVTMLNDDDTKIAAAQMNAAFDEVGTPAMLAKKFTLTEDPAEMREKMRKFMREGGRQSNITFSTITNPTNMGFSRNPSGYAQTGEDMPFAGQYPNPQNPNQSQINFQQASSKFQAMLVTAPEPSYSGLANILGGQTSQLAQNLEGLKTEMLTTRTTLAKDIAERLGVKLDQKFRPKLVEEIARMGNTATRESVAKLVQTMAPGSTPQTGNINIEEIVQKAQGLQNMDHGIKVLEQHENVEQHKPYLDHFKTVTEDQARIQNQLLQEAKAALHDTARDKNEVIELAKNALTKTGFATADSSLMSGPAVIRTVVSAADSSQAAVGAYQNGTYNPSKAVDNFVTSRMKQDHPVEAVPSKPAMNDIVPPKQ